MPLIKRSSLPLFHCCFCSFFSCHWAKRKKYHHVNYHLPKNRPQSLVGCCSFSSIDIIMVTLSLSLSLRSSLVILSAPVVQAKTDRRNQWQKVIGCGCGSVCVCLCTGQWPYRMAIMPCTCHRVHQRTQSNAVRGRYEKWRWEQREADAAAAHFLILSLIKCYQIKSNAQGQLQCADSQLKQGQLRWKR